MLNKTKLLRLKKITNDTSLYSMFFFFNDTATTEIYTLSLHDALPISAISIPRRAWSPKASPCCAPRSEEHTSELQSPCNLVCRLLLEKKNCNWHTPPVYCGGSCVSCM